MKFKTNYIEEDLVRAFKVFDPNDDEFVNKNDLRLAFQSFIQKEKISDHLINAIFDESNPQMDNNTNLDYKELIKVMMAEPDPLKLPDEL